MCSGVVQRFSVFREELDAKHDKWESIVKISRDITIESKRVIFLLHRIDIISPNTELRSKTLLEAESKIELLSKRWQQIAILLQNEDPHAYVRTYSPGLQEFIEAVSFLHYFRSEVNFDIGSIHRCLIPLDELQEILSFRLETHETPFKIPIPLTEYLLGIADTTGEAMRLCVNSAGKATSKVAKLQVFKLCAFVRLLYDMFSSFSSIVEDSSSRKNFLHNKLDVMRSSLQKVEDCSYQLGIKGVELLDQALCKDAMNE